MALHTDFFMPIQYSNLYIGDDDASDAGDPYASIRGTIFRMKRPPSKKMRILKPGQKIRRAKPKVRLGRDTIIRNDGRR